MTAAHITDTGKNYAGTARRFELRFGYGSDTMHVRRFHAQAADAPTEANRLLLEAGLAVVEWTETRTGGFTADQVVRADR